MPAATPPPVAMTTQQRLDFAASLPNIADHAVRVSYECCGRYALEGLVYAALGAEAYPAAATDLRLTRPIPACVVRADGPGPRSVLLDHTWNPAKARRRFLRRYRELTWALTPWDRFIIATRKLLGWDGCR